MNIEENDQRNSAAEDANEDPKQGAEGEAVDAKEDEQPDSLEALLKEYDEQRSEPSKEADRPSSEPTETKSDDQDVNAIAALEARIQAQEAAAEAKEMEALVGRLLEGVEADNIDAESFLIANAKQHPEVEKYYIERKQNPKRWKDTEKALKADFERRYGKKVDKDVTEGRSTLASAVRSASTAAPDQDNYSNEDISKMSKEEFDKVQRQMGVSPV